MRPRYLFLLALALLAAATLPLALAPRGNAMSIINPTSLEGNSVCAGPPATGGLLQFGGSNWCDQTTPTNLQGITFASGAFPVITFGAGKSLDLSESGTKYLELSASVNQLNKPLGWGTIATPDISETKGPRSTACFYNATALNSLATFGNYTPSVAIHIKSLHANINFADVGCTTFPVVSCSLGGVDQPSCHITMGSSVLNGDATGLNIPVAASTLVQTTVQTAGAGCTQNGINQNMCIEYTTD